MLNNKNIKKGIRAVLLVLLVFACLSFVCAPQASADWFNLGGSDGGVSALEKIKEGAVSVLKAVISGAANLINLVKSMTNPCKQGIVDKIYGGGCHACKIVKIMMSAFINGCSVLEGTAKEAGSKILIICFMMWIIFFALQQISSLKDVEPMAMLNTFLVMSFKVLCTYWVIQFGFALVLNYLIVPFLSWGVDFGKIMLDSAVQGIELNNPATPLDTSDHLVDTQGFMPASLLNNIMEYISKINGAASNHLKLAHMITCHARHAGQWTILKFVHITNFFTWFSGMGIWVLAFIIVFSVCFYLLDVSFKLAIAMVFLPILAAFWPFGALRDKCIACVKMVLNAAALFVFLSMTVSMGLVLIDKALQVGEMAIARDVVIDSIMHPEGDGAGIAALMGDIDRGDANAVSKRFSLFSMPFLMLIFCYLYAIKIVGSTINDYVNTFFPDNIGGKMQDIHHRMTGVASFAKQKAVGAVKSITKPIAKKALGSIGGKLRALGTKKQNNNTGNKALPDN